MNKKLLDLFSFSIKKLNFKPNQIRNLKEKLIINSNSLSKIGTLSSRSEVNRLGSMYINTNENSYQKPDEYEELKQYIKIEDVRISFDMDVSKPTGLSKEDFVTLVTNMKYDKTGILEKNAGVIWECCQKYNVNEIFVLGICGIESAWCSAPQHQRMPMPPRLCSAVSSQWMSGITILGNPCLTARL
jgi:beta-N-acetylglucosaminidase